MLNRLVLVTVALLLATLRLSAQEAPVLNAVVGTTSTIDARAVDALAHKILEKIPIIKVTIPHWGTTSEQRLTTARKHATGILKASEKYSDQWNSFAQEAGWQHFNARTDLPALIAALAYRESTFRSVIRNDDNSITTVIPARSAAGKKYAFDAGVMQVRVPSAPGRACGVEGKAGIAKLLEDLEFAYDVGTCVLTNRLRYYIPKYKIKNIQRFQRGLRPDKELQFFGIIGEQKEDTDAARFRELIVIERYNWGGADLYTHEIGAGYARRILMLYEFFRLS